MTSEILIKMKMIHKEDLLDSPPAYEEIYPNKRKDEMFSKQNISTDIKCLLELRDEYYRTYFTKHQVWPEGEGTYKGEMDWKGRRSGHGRMVWDDGHKIYVDEWVKDQMEGEGVIWWIKTGSYYHGGWKKGTMHGKGTLVYGHGSDTPGDVYDGDFRLVP